MRRGGTVRLGLLALLLSVWSGVGATERDAPTRLLWLEVEGTINPAVADYLDEALTAAEREGVPVVVRLDTPGGLLESTRQIVQRLLGAAVPVVVWVAPPGAHAASAGMFVTLAAHVAAMAPGTNIGAATPISGQGRDVRSEGGEDLARKVLEDTLAFARGVAQVRGRPEAWLEAAVTEAVSVTAREALELGVIDLVAASEAELLAALDGRAVTTTTGVWRLHTRGATIDRRGMGLGQGLLHRLAHPQVAYLLFIFGLLAIYFELAQPGGYIAGALGAISLALAFVSLQILPFRWAGLLLILLAVALFVAELFLPTAGVLAFAGLLSFVLGSMLLFRTPEMDLTLDPWVVAGVGIAFALTMLWVGRLLMRAQRLQPATGAEGMVGQRGETLTPLTPEGKVFVHGEIWRARLAPEFRELPRGARVRVVAVEDLVVVVAPEATVTERTVDD